MHDEMQPLDTNLPPSTQGPENGDHEGAMAKADLFKLANYSVKLFKKIDDNDQLESWVQAKITKAADYIASVYHYLEYEMKFSEFGSKLENSDVYSESEKKELKNKLMEAKEKVKELKKLQADKLAGKKTVKVKESWDDEDDDVKKADNELKKMGKKPIKAHSKADPDKDIGKLAKKSKKEDDLDEAPRGEPWIVKCNYSDPSGSGVASANKKVNAPDKESAKRYAVSDLTKQGKKNVKAVSAKKGSVTESWDDDEDDDVKKADNELKKMGKKPIKAHSKADPDKDIGKLAKKSKKEDDLDESKRAVKEAVKKAKKDYDGDGEVESEKDEVWGSRLKAAKKTGKKVDESWYDDDEDPDVAKADKELKKQKIKLPKTKADPDKDISKLAKKSKKEDDLDETSDEENDIISAPQPEPNPEENDIISAPMNESRELNRIRMLSGL